MYQLENKKKNKRKQSEKRLPLYEKVVKPLFDKILSFIALVILFPVWIVLSIAIFIDDPGPVLFTQKRVGKGNAYFTLHKFRSMKINAPHNTPTHKLRNPEQYITPIGWFLRKYSLDELPQLWDIFVGNMSIIGPRPALWNQKDLVKEREKYGANDILPGLTGYAQVNGRDELDIFEKSRMDGEYVKALHKNSVSGFCMDVSCFFRTIGNVIKHKGIIEGEAKKINFDDSIEPDIKDYGYLKTFSIDRSAKKRILITGCHSYIGESFISYVKRNYPENFEIHTVDMRDGSWKTYDFSPYDTVLHTVGIAHADTRRIGENEKQQYYAINRDLAVEAARKAKESNVRQFLFLSSMIIYGDSVYGKPKVIDEHTVPKPDNFYGDSKWQGDMRVRRLSSQEFHVAVLRMPMVYGKNSKGNYPILAKLAKILPVFPDVENQRSMLYIDNLCEFISLLILSGEGGIYFPQNSEYTKTSEMVKLISKEIGKNIRTMKSLNPILALFPHLSKRMRNVVNKAFGNNTYSQKLSLYKGLEYQAVSLTESIKQTESIGKMSHMKYSCEYGKSVLIVASVASMIDQFNIPNIKMLIRMGSNVDVAANFFKGNTCTDKKIHQLLKRLDEMRVDCYQIDFDRKIPNIKAGIKAWKQLNNVMSGNAVPVNGFHYHKLSENRTYAFIHAHSPIGGVVGRMAAKSHRIKTIYTAHGFHFYDGAPKKNWLIVYPIEWGLSWITDVLITINQEDYRRAKNRFHSGKVVYIPGVGVDIDKFSNGLIDPDEKKNDMGAKPDSIILLSDGEGISSKNYEAVFRALSELQNPKIIYFIVGKVESESEWKELVHSLSLDEQVYFLGLRTDLSELCQAADLFVYSSSNQEKTSLALMEAVACKTPVMCSKNCNSSAFISSKEYLFEESDVNDIAHCLARLAVSRKKIMTSVKVVMKENKKLLKAYILELMEESTKQKAFMEGINNYLNP